MRSRFNHRDLYIILKSLAVVSAALAGSIYSLWLHPWYWAACGGLLGLLFGGPPLRRLVARIYFRSRVRKQLPATGLDLSRLAAAATAIKTGDCDRAMYLLEDLTLRNPHPATLKAKRWLQTLAAVHWMARQTPGRALSGLHQPFPQLHALIFSYGPQRTPLRKELLLRELAQVTSADLDQFARDYILLVDSLIEALNDPESAFREEAEELLEFTTGKRYLIGGRERIKAWWSSLRPVLLRGGGALLAAVRLLQRDGYAETSELLARIGADGLLSDEADTLQRMAAFLTIFARPPWRMTSSADIPRYFNEGCYYLVADMGVLRYPTAELPEVLDCCQRGETLRERKRKLIEDALNLWTLLDEDLAPQFALLMRRLLEYKGRSTPQRVNFWRDLWSERKAGFDRMLTHLMDGIALTAAGKRKEAAQHFETAARLDPGCSVPLVNQVYLRLREHDKDGAQRLIKQIVDQFPTDGQALLAVGRMLATHLEDTKEAEKLFLRAFELLDPPTEALIYLGEIKLMDGLYLESQQYFEHARQLDPTQPHPKLGLARVYMETRRFDLAIENLKAVLDGATSEESNLAHYFLYRIYRENGVDREAFKHLDHIPTRFFKEPDVLDDIAVHLESEKHYARAREFSERAMLLRANGRYSDDGSDALSAI